MKVLQVFVVEMTAVRDIFGTFVSRFKSLLNHIFGFVTNSIKKIEAYIIDHAGRAPPAKNKRKDNNISQGI